MVTTTVAGNRDIGLVLHCEVVLIRQEDPTRGHRAQVIALHCNLALCHQSRCTRAAEGWGDSAVSAEWELPFWLSGKKKGLPNSIGGPFVFDRALQKHALA